MCALCVGIICAPGTPNATLGPTEREGLFAAIIGQGVPGILFLILAWWMSRGHFLAFIATIVATVAFIIKCLVSLVMPTAALKLAFSAPCCGPLFCGYVGARAIIAWPEIMHLRRVNAHERQAPAAIAAGPGMAVPPPPTRLPPRPRRELR